MKRNCGQGLAQDALELYLFVLVFFWHVNLQLIGGH